MSKFKIRLVAQKAGSIGKPFTELRWYEIEAESRDAAREEATLRAYADGLEHTLITRCEDISDVPA